MSEAIKTPEESFQGLISDIIEMFAPSLAEALQELADQMSRPLTLTFKSDPMGEEVRVNAVLGAKLKTSEEEVSE